MTNHPSPQPRRLLRRLALLSATLAFVLLSTSTTALAEEVFTSQAAAAHATDSTWIPAPSKRAAICLVDTGVTPNPDTTNVIARFSVDNGPPDDLSPDHHGTLMAMIASAPYNNFGMVGAAPSINVVSVRASRDGRTFGGNDVAAALQLCINKRTTYNIKAVSLSFGGAAIKDLDGLSMALAEDTVNRARRAELATVAAAGNHQGPVDWPAAYSAVLAVGAADMAGDRCPFAASGPEVDIWVLGCPVDVATIDGSPAWASGSSEAGVFVAAVLVQLRQEREDLTAVEAEAALTKPTPGERAGHLLDVEAAFRTAGLADRLATGHIKAPIDKGLMSSRSSLNAQRGNNEDVPSESAGPRNPQMAAPVTISDWRVLPRPIARQVRAKGSTVALALRNRPRGAEVCVELYVLQDKNHLPRSMKVVRRGTSHLRIRVSGSISQASIVYRDPDRVMPPSPALDIVTVTKLASRSH